MSWNIFKQNMNRFLSNVDNVTSTEMVADKWTFEYDSCMRRGYDFVNLAPIQKGNPELMKQLLKIALDTGKAKTSNFDFIGSLKSAITAYWSGGIMSPFPIPIIPAPGSYLNVAVNSNNVSNPGTWNPQSVLLPSNSSNLMVELFVLSAILHLQTVGGVIITTSLYPPIGTPAPGIISWTGYTIPA